MVEIADYPALEDLPVLIRHVLRDVASVFLVDRVLRVQARNDGAALLMEVEHGLEIEVGRVVAAAEEDVLFLELSEVSKVGLHGLEPVLVSVPSRLSRERRQEPDAGLLSVEIPSCASPYVPHQASVVLRSDYSYIPDPCVRHIRKHEIYESVSSSVRNGRERPEIGQSVEVYVIGVSKYQS